MSLRQEQPPAHAFFLDAAPGKRFCLYHAPHSSRDCQGAFIYLHSFAEEMNKSRRMAALQSRALAAMGYAVLQIDLFGCGDSSGDFADARWEIWKQDIAAACTWLQQQTNAPISLWGLRLGALLALDFSGRSQFPIENLVLWQPVTRGELFITQFLRLRLATAALAGQADTGNGTRTLRNALASGETLEIAGYALAPALAEAIDALDAAQLAPTSSTVHWLELVAEPGRPRSPETTRVAATWLHKNLDLHLQQVQCPPFWLSQEIVECPALLSATCDDLRGELR